MSSIFPSIVFWFSHSKTHAFPEVFLSFFLDSACTGWLAGGFAGGQLEEHYVVVRKQWVCLRPHTSLPQKLQRHMLALASQPDNIYILGSDLGLVGFSTKLKTLNPQEIAQERGLKLDNPREVRVPSEAVPGGWWYMGGVKAILQSYNHLPLSRWRTTMY